MVTNGGCIVLSAVFASDEACEWVRKIVASDLGRQYRFEVVTTERQAALLSDSGASVHCVQDASALQARLSELAPVIVQTFSMDDHQAAARYATAHRIYLLATHLSAAQAIVSGRENERLYNKLTDLNLFIDNEAMSKSNTPGFLWLKNPVLLTQAQLGDNSVLSMLGHAISSLVSPSRVDVCGNVKTDYSDLRLSYVTHFYCNQQDISSVTRLLERYAAYPPEVLARVQFVIVDDGSPIEYEVPDLPLNLTWLKIDQDIRWNQAGARNLGAVYARADTLLLTDLDHEVPVETMRQLIEMPSCGKRLYKMWRQDEQGKMIKGHPNFFVMSRGRFMECHGYDEEFAGHYGAEDFRFVKYQKARGSFQKYLPKSMWCFERLDINRSKSYHSLVRDLSFNSATDSRKRHELANIGHGYGHSRMFLNFTWKIVADRQVNFVVSRPQSRSWKHRSLLRQLFPRF